MRMLWPQVGPRGSQSIEVYVSEPIEEWLDNFRQEVFKCESGVPRITEAETYLTRGIEV